MGLPNFILSNLRWKLVALCLAVAGWFTVRFSLVGDIRPQFLGPATESTFNAIPVQTLTMPGDQRVFQISPREVEVKIRRLGTRTDQILSSSDINVFVNIGEITLVSGLSRVMEVQVHTPKGVEIVSLNPASVAVEQIATLPEPPPGQSLTNSLIKP
jgi:hypothetical protein